MLSGFEGGSSIPQARAKARLREVGVPPRLKASLP